MAHHGSGEIFLALSTTARAARGEPSPPGPAGAALDPLFSAAVDATEEAVLNALWSAERIEGRGGFVAERLPHEEVLDCLRRHGRL